MQYKYVSPSLRTNKNQVLQQNIASVNILTCVFYNNIIPLQIFRRRIFHAIKLTAAKFSTV